MSNGFLTYSPEYSGLSGMSYTQRLNDLTRSDSPFTSTPLQSRVGDVEIDTPSFLDRTKGVLGNEGLMKGMLGAGQLGLGVMSYLDNSKLMREQLRGLKQNRKQAAQGFADQQAQRAAINAGFSSAVNP